MKVPNLLGECSSTGLEEKEKGRRGINKTPLYYIYRQEVYNYKSGKYMRSRNGYLLIMYYLYTWYPPVRTFSFFSSLAAFFACLVISWRLVCSCLSMDSSRSLLDALEAQV